MMRRTDVPVGGEGSRAQRACMTIALEDAGQRMSEWGLPILGARTERAWIVGQLVRDRALLQVSCDLVGHGTQRRRRAPWGGLWSTQWWDQVILPAARTRDVAGWWTVRAPLDAIGWARLLDPPAEDGPR